MRRTLLGGLVETLSTNLKRKASRVRVFECGRVFREARADPAVQPQRVGGLAFGDALPSQWGEAARTVDLFDVKGDLEALVAPRRLTTEREAYPWLHPGRSARVRIDGEDAGWLGELHPRLARQFEMPRPPVVFELDLAAVSAWPLPTVVPVSKQPVVRRDIAVVVDDAVPAQAMLEALEAARPAHVEAVRLFDVYRGAGLPSGRKSLAILVLMQDTARTLTDADIDATMAAIICPARERCGRHTCELGPTMTLTKAELADLLFEKVGLNKREAKDMVEAFFEEIRIALETGDSVKLSGFGNFQLRDKPQRPGRNPKTGEEIPITARRVVTFHASQKLKAMVEAANHGNHSRAKVRAPADPGQALLHHR